MADLLLEYNHVKLESMGDLTDGRIKFTDQHIAFKNGKTGKVETVANDRVKGAVWTRLANLPALKLHLSDDTFLRFGNFSEQDFDKLASFAHSVWGVELAREGVSVKGWNYGKVVFDGPMLDFRVEDTTAFLLPLANVCHASTGKNETVVGIQPNDDCAVCLTEIRFHVSPDDDEEVNACEDMKEKILQHASVVKDTDAPLTVLEQIMCNPPRGRYDLKLFPNHLSFHGKSFDYKVPVKSILRLFLLPHRDGRHMFFVMGLDPPIRQGQARYHYIVLEFVKDEEIEVQMSLDEEKLRELFGDKLETEMSGPKYEVISRIMRALVNQRITVPGSFVGHSGATAVGAAYKSTAGNLYPLEKGFVFVNKPTMYIRYEEVSIVHFARSDVSTRSFDFEVELTNGVVHVFNSIEKEEYSKLYDFVTKKKLRIRNAKKAMGSSTRDNFMGSSDDDEETGGRDHYKERLKAEAAAAAADSDESSDEEDEDFDPDAEAKRQKEADDLQSDMSEPDDEYDSDVKTTTEEDEEEEEKEEEGSKAKKAKHSTERKAGGSKGGKKETKRGSKATKDPNAPKRGLSAYMIWLNANRASLTKEGMAVTEVAKAAGIEWGKMTDKTEWEAKAKTDKERYQREMAVYTPSTSSTADATTTKTARKKATVSPSKNVQSREYLSTTDDSSDDEDKKGGKANATEEDSD